MTLARAELEELLLQRAPILMLDRVVDIVPRASGTGIRRFGQDDPCFRGHFPGKPILPGIFAIEALAQTGAIILLAARANEFSVAPFGLLGNVKEMIFRERIVPNDE